MFSFEMKIFYMHAFWYKHIEYSMINSFNFLKPLYVHSTSRQLPVLQ